MSVWLRLGNEGIDKEGNGSFCAPTPSAMVFGRSDGDRVAVTRDLSLRPGYTLQFKVLGGISFGLSGHSAATWPDRGFQIYCRPKMIPLTCDWVILIT